MRRIFLLLILLVYVHTAFPQAENADDGLVWYSDVNKAHDKSKLTNLPIFAFFTGSDWCGWCHKLQREVFSKPAFKKWASENVVLLELDFPRRKELPVELVQQNLSLQQFFEVRGYPTIWIFSISKDLEKKTFMISPLGKLGYPSAPEPGKEEIKFLEEANTILSRSGSR